MEQDNRYTWVNEAHDKCSKQCFCIGADKCDDLECPLVQQYRERQNG